MVKDPSTALVVIRTRFSVKSGKWPDFMPTKQWLEYRKSIIEMMALPSIRKINDANFLWLIECSNETEVFVRNMVASWKCNFAKVVTHGGDDIEGFATLNLATLGVSELHKLVIQTRLDSDDALHRNFVLWVREHLCEEFPLVRFDGGYKIDAAKSKVYQNRYISSPFFAVWGNPNRLSFGSAGHKTIGRDFNYKSLKNPAFIQSVHGGNVRVTLNHEGLRLVKPNIAVDILGDFGLGLDTLDGLSILAENGAAHKASWRGSLVGRLARKINRNLYGKPRSKHS